MGKKSGPPPAPDYRAAAEETAKSNERANTAQTWANRPEQIDPWGRTSWATTKEIDPATGQEVTKWTQNTTLDPRLQSALDSQIAVQQGQSDIAQGLLGRVRDEYSTPMDWGNMQEWGKAPQAGSDISAVTNPYGFSLNAQNIDTSRMGGYGDYRGRAEDAIYKSATSRLDPQWQQRQADLDTQLANQGISRNSAAYQREMDNFNRSRTDAYQQAQNAAITGGGEEAQRNFGMDSSAMQNQLAAQQALFQQQQAAGMFGLGQEQQYFGQMSAADAQNFQQQLQQSNYENMLRQSQLTEAQQRRGFSLNEIQALLNGQQVNTPQFQNFNQAGNAGGVDYSGAAQNQYSGAMDAYNAAQAQGANKMQAIGGIASAAAMAF